jgi:hypothetical protein
MPHRRAGRGALGRTPATREAVVRLYPDYAGSVLWVSDSADPVDYASSGLDPALVNDLIRWELGYYDSLDDDFQWRSPASAGTFTSDGVALALRLAVQLGAGFDIEFASYEAGVATRRFRSAFPADNPGAAAAFAVLAGQSTVISPVASRPSRSVRPSRPRKTSSWLTTNRPPR